MFLLKWADELYLVFPNYESYDNGEWARVRLDYKPTVEQARAALQLSPANGKQIAPKYSQVQILRFMDQAAEAQEQQIKANRAMAKTHNFQEHPLRSQHCNHASCTFCRKEISCMEEDHIANADHYHTVCWWEHNGLSKEFDGAEGGSWWVMHGDDMLRFEFEPTLDEAKFALTVTWPKGTKISRPELNLYQHTMERLMELHAYKPERALELAAQSGIRLPIDDNFEAFIEQRIERHKQIAADIERLEGFVFQRPMQAGDVVDVRATDVDRKWADAFTGVFVEFAENDKDAFVAVKTNQQFCHRLVAANRLTLRVPKEKL